MWQKKKKKANNKQVGEIFITEKVFKKKKNKCILVKLIIGSRYSRNLKKKIVEIPRFYNLSYIVTDIIIHDCISTV